MHIVRVLFAPFALLLIGACHLTVLHHVDAGPAPGETCSPCESSSDCHDGSCVQIGGDDACAATCSSSADCNSDETCTSAVSSDGSQVSVCMPKSGSCGGDGGCGTCPAGTTCDASSGSCVSGVDAGPGQGSCGSLVSPSTPSQCTSCGSGSHGDCQPNGCYGGWWCDTTDDRCHPAPSSCSGEGEGEGGVVDVPDAGPITGSVTSSGGSVSRLYFAVVGDTRPANEDQTSNYPTATITSIYQDIESLDPKPQFVLSTGDYMFANASGSQGAPQIAKYQQAEALFTNGPHFAAMGNHECTGYTAGNCASNTTHNMQAYIDTFLTPNGFTKPYYSVPFQASDGSWTAKLVVLACNAWDSTQKTWAESALAQATTYTIVSQHEPSSTYNAPCTNDVKSLLSAHPYDLFLVGHTHTYEQKNKEFIIGNGGAPITGSAVYGFATVEMIPGTGFRVTEYDASSASPIRSAVVPH